MPVHAPDRTDTLSIKDVSERSGLSIPTLRYYEDVGLIGPIERDGTSHHRVYRERDLDDLQVLACLRAMGVGIEDMRTYQANRGRGRESAGEQRDLLTRHAERVEEQIARLHVHVRYLRAKAALWDARVGGDADVEAAAHATVESILPELAEAIR